LFTRWWLSKKGRSAYNPGETDMLFNDEDTQDTKPRLNARQKLFILCIDVAIIVELCISMSVATSHMDTFTPSFMKTFFAMFLPTLVAGFAGHRMLRRANPSAEQSQS